MSWFTDIITAGVGGLIKDVGSTVRQYVTTDKDRIELEQKLTGMILEHQDKMVSHADAYEQELTKRQEIDMRSDSWLSKNIRPMSLVYLMSVFTVLALTDGNINWATFSFVVKDVYVQSFSNFTEYFIMFYAGGRSLEKIAGMVSSARRK